jgi:hypothetical protein
MVLVYLKTSECIEIEDAVGAERRGQMLACFDAQGSVAASFPLLDVEGYTTNPKVAETMKQDVCEDLTVMSNGRVVEEPDRA